jgi:hypothetical protein
VGVIVQRPCPAGSAHLAKQIAVLKLHLFKQRKLIVAAAEINTALRVAGAG